MAVAVPVATSPGWPNGQSPHGSTEAEAFHAYYVVFPPQTEAQKRLLQELVEWSINEGGLDPDILMHIDEDAWGITND